jgi:hypothetical protein
LVNLIALAFVNSLAMLCKMTLKHSKCASHYLYSNRLKKIPSSKHKDSKDSGEVYYKGIYILPKYIPLHHIPHWS